VSAQASPDPEFRSGLPTTTASFPACGRCVEISGQLPLKMGIHKNQLNSSVRKVQKHQTTLASVARRSLARGVRALDHQSKLRDLFPCGQKSQTL
jgi:hypothetical protein